MAYRDLRDFIHALDKAGELKRIRFEVGPFPYNPGKYWVTVGLSSRRTGQLYHVQTQRYLFEVIDAPRVQERVEVPVRIEVEDL